MYKSKLPKTRPAPALAQLKMLSPEERHQLLDTWNATEAPYPAQLCVQQLFEAQAAQAPEAVALVCEDQSLTYGELNTQANRLARHLRTLGVGPDQRVAICVERSIEMVVGLLAILKAGGAYVPLDPTYPAERLAFMLQDSAPKVVLTHKAAQEALAAALKGPGQSPPVIDLIAEATLWADQPSDNPDPHQIGLSSRNLAYVIYTSGSTGTPKGVMVEHRGVVNLCGAQGGLFQVTPRSRVLQFASMSFDASIFEILMALGQGAGLYLRPVHDRLAGAALGDMVKDLRISHATLTPMVLASLPQDGVDLDILQILVLAGEALPKSLADRWCEGRSLFNAYGPTEATVWATLHRHRRDLDRQDTTVPIGRPISNTRIYLLDGSMQPVPVGVAGEIYIGGAGVARGYLNRPELTAEKFLASPFVEGDRLYRTGDLARYLPDGNIEFLGRNDFQVKIRGFRIELGEIEARMGEHPQVREAVVLAREDVPGEKRLVAYYVPAADEPEVEALRAHLGDSLPDYMVPAAYVRLDALPLTPNGKLDRKALPAPDGEAYATAAYEAPVGPVEETLARIWAEVLGLDRVGRHDNFFELGGHSLLAVRVLERLRSVGLGASVSDLFNTPNLRALAAYINKRPLTAAPWLAPLRERAGHRRLALFMPTILGSGLHFLNVADRLDPSVDVATWRLPGSEPGEPAFDRLEDIAAYCARRLEDLLAYDEITLIGWSFGGLLAFETARQTRQVSTHVILIDTVAQLSEQLFPTDDTQLNIELDQHLRNIKHQYLAVDREIVFNAFKRNIEAVMRYRTTPLDGKVFDIRASETNKQMVQAKNATWLEATDHSVVYLPGDHFSILDSNSHSALADLINRNIARGAPVAGKA